VELISCCFDCLIGNFLVFLCVFSKEKTVLPFMKNGIILTTHNSIRYDLQNLKISVSPAICRFVTAVSPYSLTSISFYLPLHLPLFTNLNLLGPFSSYTQKHRYCQFSIIFVQSNQILFSIKYENSSQNFISTIQRTLLKVHRQKQNLYLSSCFLIQSLTCCRLF